MSHVDPSHAYLLTPPGASAIAVLRLSGPLVEVFLRDHVTRPASPGRCVHATLRDGETVIDDPVLVRSADSSHLDVNLHGGPWVVQSTLALARRVGFRVNSPTPLPLPPECVYADTPLARDVLRYLPLARTELAIRELLDQQRAWQIFDQLASADRRALAAETLEDRSLHWLLHPPRVAIVGPANAGKSTLANQLFAQQRSITADVPGTTRDWVGEIANVDGLAVMLVDTPGLRSSDDPLEQAAISRARPEIARADLVLLVLDATRPLADQQELLDCFPDAVKILNKSDRRTFDFKAVGGVPTTASTGDGVDGLRSLIKEYFHVGARPGQPKWWTEELRERLSSM